jgi:hypothetical protein
MHGEIHRNRVLYREHPQPGHRYRQIVVVEKDRFEVLIFEGDVVQTDPQFIAQCSDAEISLHQTLKAALAEAESEFQRSITAGWTPYYPRSL